MLKLSNIIERVDNRYALLKGYPDKTVGAPSMQIRALMEVLVEEINRELREMEGRLDWEPAKQTKPKFPEKLPEEGIGFGGY